MSKIIVNIGPPDSALDTAWEDLVRRAPENVFMSPVALRAAASLGFADIVVLAAWAADDGRLLGLWGLRKWRRLRFAPMLLAAPPYEYAFASMPVIDAAHMDAVVGAFLDAIERDRRLPSVLRLKYLDAESAACVALRRQVALRGIRQHPLGEGERPYASREAGRKESGSTRKKLRQDWNRLSALGTVDIVNDREPVAAKAAFEVFLAMEAASWKGDRGTALLCDAADAAFARRLVGDLASAGDASVALLRLDGRPIAAQVLLYCGSMAYTWKTAFEADFRKYSPGVLLIDKLTEQLFATPAIAAIESCSPEGGFMSQLWAGHRTTLGLLIDVGRRASPAFLLAVAGERAYVRLRGWRNRLRGGLQRWQARPPPPSERPAG
jgi:CelD/BcsL family acetyltransferase involved in cellulose biosynthesis